MKSTFTTTSNAEPKRQRRRLFARLAAGLTGIALLASGGCGAIGLYSLGHSILAHNHVLKPVLPDDPANCGEDHAERGAGAPVAPASENRSSRGQIVPMEITRSQAGDMTSAECDQPMEE